MTQAANLAALGTNAGTTGILPIAGGGTAGTGGAIGFKNRVINGNMTVSQRNGTTAVNNDTSGTQYSLDRWCIYGTQASKFSVGQYSTAPTGFSNSLGVSSNSAYTLNGTDTFWIRQPIEGYNIVDLSFGTASAKTINLSFWVRSSLTGTFGGTLKNNVDQNYPFSYTISSADTWEQKTITITGSTSGTWATTNGAGLYVLFSMGTNYTGTAGAWAGGYIDGATGQTSIVSTSGANWYVTGVQLEVGTAATNFDVRSYTTELQLCQRYFEAGSLWREGTNSASGNFCVFTLSFLVQKRANATFTYGNVGGSNASIASIQGPEATYEWISPFDQTNTRTGFAFRFIPNNNTSTLRQYWTASAEL